LIPAFSEPRMPIGRGIFEPNPRRFDEGAGKVSAIYRTPDPRQAYYHADGAVIYRLRGMTARLNHSHLSPMGGTE